MGIVVTYITYLVISVALTVFVGSALSRSGRAFLLDAFSGRVAPTQAVTRLLVVGFYLLSLGFVTLTMRTTGEIGSAREAFQVLSVKVGEVLLVLGALYLVSLAVLTRLRHRIQAQAFQRVPPAEDQPLPEPDLPEPDLPELNLPQPRLPETPAPGATLHQAATPGPGTADAHDGQASPASSRNQGLWSPRPRQVIH